MTRFILIRHGETTWNAEGRIQGHKDIPLTDKGLRQAQLAAERLRHTTIDAVFSSDLSRASATAAALATIHNLPVVTTPLLREARLGVWQGMTVKEAADKYPEAYELYRTDSVSNRPPGAEYLEEVIARCREFIEIALNDYPNGTVAIACHGGSVRGLIAAAYGLGPEFYRKVRLDNGGISVFSVTDDKPLLESLNDTCHLTEEVIGSGVDR